MKKSLGWVDLASQDARGAHILIVDDDAAILRTLGRLVVAVGYRVKTADAAMTADTLQALQDAVTMGRLLVDRNGTAAAGPVEPS